MTTLAPILESFFTDRLQQQLHASPHTVRSYRVTFRLLLVYAHEHTGKQPVDLDLGDLDATLIGGFFDYLEHERHNTVRTRNARLATIRSMFRYASYREPADAAVIQRVLSIAEKRSSRSMVSFLSPTEVNALLAAPDRGTWIGRRDHTLIATAIQTGLRVSELTGLRHHRNFPAMISQADQSGQARGGRTLSMSGCHKARSRRPRTSSSHRSTSNTPSTMAAMSAGVPSRRSTS